MRASSRLPVVSIQVTSLKVYLVLRSWLKQRRIFTQNVFLVQLQTSPSEVIEIFVQFHCLSSYRNDRFPSERLQQAKGIRKQCAEMRCKRIYPTLNFIIPHKPVQKDCGHPLSRGNSPRFSATFLLLHEQGLEIAARQQTCKCSMQAGS